METHHRALLGLSLIVILVSCSEPRGAPVGERLVRYSDQSRRSWTNPERARPLATSIWYPAPADTRESKHHVAVFDTGFYAINAPLAPGPDKMPLIILSHGTGGSAASLAWCAEALAKSGFIVAAINHHGNTGFEPSYTMQGFMFWWERPRDVTKVIDSVLSDSTFGPRVDPNRIGVAGFSLGGYTALASVGAILNPDQMKGVRNLAPPPESPFGLEAFKRFVDEDPSAAEEYKHASDSYKDPRIKAAFLMAPVQTSFLDKDSLRHIAVPVMIVGGDRDNQSVLEENGAVLKQYIPDSTLTVLRGASHYSFLCSGTLWGKIVARNLTADGAGFSREGMHQNVETMAIDFFTKQLK